MSSMIEDFLEGSKRVTAYVYYFIPLNEGEKPRQLPTKIIGEKPIELHHAGILQQFVYQQDDRADVKDELKDIFAKVMETSNGIVKIHDRSQRIALMHQEGQLEAQRDLAGGVRIESLSGIPVPQILIPKPHEEAVAGMEDISRTFKTLIPFPRLRGFLQYWQENVSGPLHHVQYVAGNLTSGYQNHHAIN